MARADWIIIILKAAPDGRRSVGEVLGFRSLIAATRARPALIAQHGAALVDPIRHAPDRSTD